MGREEAHEAIKEAAVGAALDMRRGQDGDDVFARLAADPRIGLSAAGLGALVAAPIDFTGAAVTRVRAVIAAVEAVTARYPGAAGGEVYRFRGRYRTDLQWFIPPKLGICLREGRVAGREPLPAPPI